MESDLIELFEGAKKAADAAALDGVASSGPEVSRCLDALKQLKKFPVTYDTLVATQVGKKLRSLAKHPVEDIKTVATDLLEIWKKVVIEETAKAKKTESTNGCKAATVKEAKVNKMDVEKPSNPAPVKVQKLQRGDSAKSIKVERKETDSKVTTGVKIERKEPDNKVTTGVKVERKDSDNKVTNGAKIDFRGQAVKDEKVSKESQSSMKAPAKAPNAPPKLTSMLRCNDPVRDKIRELLADAFVKVAGEADDYERESVTASDPLRVAVSVESLMFEKLGRSTGAQKLKYRSIMFNLRDSNNPDLRRRVLTGEISPEKLITLSAEDMASDKRKQENNQIKEKYLFDCERGLAAKASTDQFKCGRCGQRKCTYYQMQTRSADEPMTTYVTCVNCDNHWKFC
ncbi:PREDICTED: transcription elongation factor TFIIS [Camelina sativa]|uniref:Transcription elongation factor n=1 Tax=Camelina sativa TaxID=90675 RepID=A0ABM0Z1K9_CAMSA|nr:PREDICTED: transcription elongation factor TFIIS [Camelina sativa]